MIDTEEGRRDLDVSEGRLTSAIVVGLMAFGFAIYLGSELHRMLGASARPVLLRGAVPAVPPAGFIGPPALQEPTPIGGGAGRGAGRPYHFLVLETENVEADRRELLAQGFPAYVGQDQLRVGDYATAADLAANGAKLAERGHRFQARTWTDEPSATKGP